jgi:thioredoxin reductase (NADPH)
MHAPKVTAMEEAAEGTQRPERACVTRMNASNCSSEGIAHDEVAFPILNAGEIHQALKFGAQFSAPCDVAQIRRAEDGLHSVHLQDGSVANTKTVIVATGVRYRSLGVEGLNKLSGTGVYYSATHVEALLCDERPLHVIGAGNSAGQAAMFLSRFNAKVNLIVRGSDLRKSMSSYLVERVQANSRIHVRLHSELRAVTGADSLDEVLIENVATSETTIEDSCAVFIFIGATPCTDFLGDRISKDKKGFLITGAELIAKGTWPDPNRVPRALETSCPGIFAAGDSRSGTTKRVAFAVGDGALAVTCVHDLLVLMHRKMPKAHVVGYP